jgi:hypothetical protein
MVSQSSRLAAITQHSREIYRRLIRTIYDWDVALPQAPARGVSLFLLHWMVEKIGPSQEKRHYLPKRGTPCQPVVISANLKDFLQRLQP